jgi:predicted nucleic acid-binding protein
MALSVPEKKAARAWSRYIARRREHPPRSAKRPVADVLIGGFALRFDGLITRNTGDFRKLFPGLRLICRTRHHPKSLRRQRTVYSFKWRAWRPAF